MGFAQELTRVTAADRNALLGQPLVRDALAGQVSRDTYLAFLTQAYHHVRQTVPLLMAVGARLEHRHPWLQRRVLHYLNEEIGHEQWVLNDITAIGGDADAVVTSRPNVETDAMIAYAWDTASRRNPVGFFGMVQVLEGTSVEVAAGAARAAQHALDLPEQAFSYLRSHGELDQSHIRDLAEILDRLNDPGDQAAVIECARAMYWLYGQMLAGVRRAVNVRGQSDNRSIA